MNVTIDPILAYRAELRRAASRGVAARRRRRLLVLAVIAVGVLVTGISIAATGWFTAEPAPKPVVEDFKAYTPQLGVHPEPGKAVFVAQDGEFKLYATTNREGTYCLVVDLPWRRPQAGDGGVCVPKRDATEPLTAAAASLGVVVGRVPDHQARTIRFATLEGESIEAPLGAEGFFIVSLDTGRDVGSACWTWKGDWAPIFTALDGSGTPVRTARILLVRVDRALHACGFPNIPHGPELRRGPLLGKGPY